MRLRHPRNTPLARSVALALGIAAAPFAYAQTAAAPAPGTLEEVVVTGIRASLTSSEGLKRNSVGFVDGIVAEDIGKFPDTNLAEAMQRITGVSIDRVNGEGSKVSVRGIGSDYNLVLLNGRQMPGANINDTSASDSRSFDFANLASEAIAAIEVHKTSSADRPTGGLGAVVNIKTTRPLEAGGRVAAFGVKAVTDRSNNNLPDKFKGSTFTPEILGDLQQHLRGQHLRRCRSRRATRTAQPATTRPAWPAATTRYWGATPVRGARSTAPATPTRSPMRRGRTTSTRCRRTSVTS